MEIKTRSASTGTADHQHVWNRAYLRAAENEGRKILSEDQYAHAVGLFDGIACEPNPRKSPTQDVRPVEDDIYELRDKGGILGKINLRVYFLCNDGHHTIIALACSKKENEGQIAGHMMTRIRNRAKIATQLLNARSAR